MELLKHVPLRGGPQEGIRSKTGNTPLKVPLKGDMVSLFLISTLLLSGCQQEAIQSALHPASPAATAIADLWWLMLAVLSGVAAVTIALMLIGIFKRRTEGPPLGPTRFVVLSGIIIPAIILVGLLVMALRSTAALDLPESRYRIQVIGHRWWWEVRYPDSGVVTANEIHIPAGEPVRLEVWAADVIHSLWVPRLNGKIDLLPEKVNHFWLQAAQPGTYRGQCAEFCGVQHARMALMVVALPRPRFEAWLADKVRTPASPTEPLLSRGRDVFFEAHCDACHRIKGTDAESTIGPDLSHLGSRLTLGAGTIENTTGNLEGWIADSQAIKPGNEMPPIYLPPEDLHALRAYLESLR